MSEIPFSIPVSGIICIGGDQVTVTVNRAETIVQLGSETRLGVRISFEGGKNMFDIILETTHEFMEKKGLNRFSAPELYVAARERYPGLKRGSFMARVIASTPDHPSYKHHTSTRDYFSRIGKGLYWLNEQYTVDKNADTNHTMFNQRNMPKNSIF